MIWRHVLNAHCISKPWKWWSFCDLQFNPKSVPLPPWFPLDQDELQTIEADSFDPRQHIEKSNTHKQENAHTIVALMVPEGQRSSALPWSKKVRDAGKKRRCESVPSASISKIGLSLPGRCLFVSLRRGLKKKRMQAARRHKETARERKTMIGDGGGGEPSLRWDHLHRPLFFFFAGRLCGRTKRCREGTGERRVRKVSSVESEGGVRAMGLPHAVPPPRLRLPGHVQSSSLSSSCPFIPAQHRNPITCNRICIKNVKLYLDSILSYKHRLVYMNMNKSVFLCSFYLSIAALCRFVTFVCSSSITTPCFLWNWLIVVKWLQSRLLSAMDSPTAVVSKGGHELNDRLVLIVSGTVIW